jgi:hypothetical protein
MAKGKVPTALLVPGWDKKNPQRARERENEPETPTLGSAPAHIRGKRRKQIWEEIRTSCAAGLLQQSDALAVESLVNLTYEMRFKARDWTASKQSQMTMILKQLGMTPAARASVKVENPKGEGKKSEGGDFDDF